MIDPIQPRTDPYAEIDRLGNEIAELSAHIQAATYQLLVLIREFDARGGWNSGFRSCAHWLNWRTGLDMGAAREKVRVARALEDLPEISEAMRLGRLSYSKVRALTRIATSENEAELVEFALSGTAAHVEKLVRAWRRVDRIEAMAEGDRQRQHRYLRAHHDEDGMLVVQARLAPEVGAVFLKAIEAANEVLFKQSRQGEKTEWADLPFEQRRADALELVAESALEGGLDPGTAGDRYQVVVHVQDNVDVAAETSRRSIVATPKGDDLDIDSRVSAETGRCGGDCAPHRSGEPDNGLRVSAETSFNGNDLAAIQGGELENGLRVSAETSRRLQCDGSRVVMTHDSDGKVLDVGRKTRTIHPALRRALQHRDGGCRFPGCGLQICDAHHVEHWAEGGETNLENLLLLCRHHHRALHEEGFRVELESDGTSRFFTSRGALIPDSPVPPLLNGDPADALKHQHREDGLEIDSMTGFPRWDGGGFDLGYAIDALRHALADEDAGEDVSAETSPHRQGRLLLFDSE